MAARFRRSLTQGERVLTIQNDPPVKPTVEDIYHQVEPHEQHAVHNNDAA
jgi:hypothetical protein